MEANQAVQTNAVSVKTKTKASFYQIVWRWHFYAGLFAAPFLIVLAISGGVYLFKPQIESMLYKDLYYVEQASDASEATALAPSALIHFVQQMHPDGQINSIMFYDDRTRTVEIGMTENDIASSVFINPYSGEVLGSLVSGERFTDIFVKMHSELIIGGTVANYLVELAACWTVILLLTGLYMWWPRNRASIWGTVLPRFRQKGKVFWRDMHAVPAFWLSLFILILVLTGLPWSAVTGKQISSLATSTNTGYPPYALGHGAKPESTLKTKDVAKGGPWATENLPVPVSMANNYVPLTINEAVTIAEGAKVEKPYRVVLPKTEKGVYTVTTRHTVPGGEATLHLDQYSGAILSDVRYADYGIMGKAITVGIALHEGRLFGLANQLLGLITCLGVIGIVISSFVMWRKRKPQAKLGSPTPSKDKHRTRVVFVLMLVMGVLMPLVGISIIVVFVLDRFVLSRIKPVKAWLHGA
ncbi:PepSY domain-containing protein [Paenibacillus arenosi]|uniref:PepSY domain-containing protein n=1 Tax=Paenibacillus arenosi TaxID=2774142 RepID=A0ABR9ASB5_9BACL|nr:PepSY domain-containing protein [Paenibacillus arenosi]